MPTRSTFAPLVLVLLAFLVLMAPLEGQRRTDPLQGLDAYAARALADWDVPGMSIVVVRGDSVIFSRGFGVRRLGDPAPVDAETIFAIGSNSKAFTAAGLAMLVDDGTLGWDDAVIDHLPWFRVADPWITRALNLRDLLSHRSGLARDDALWYASGRSAGDVVRRLRFQGSELPFRAGWLYNNNMYLTAGEVIAATSGQTWDDFTTRRILRPLGMRTASTTVRGLERLPNVAAPHAVIDGKLAPVPYRNIDNAGPAGSINASALDMARWLTFQIDSGRIDGRTLLNPKQFEEMWAGHAIIRDPFFRQLLGGGGFLEYGLGWFLGAHEARRLVLHGGNIDGMSALVSFMPEERIGVVILTNRNQTFVHSGLTFWIYDRLLGLPVVDRSSRLLGLMQAAAKGDAGEAAQLEASRIPGTAPRLPLAAYAGTYADSLYGSIEVRSEGGELTIELNPGFIGTLEHWHFDTFRARYRDPTANMDPKRFVTFRLDPAGKVVGVVVDGFTTFGRVGAK